MRKKRKIELIESAIKLFAEKGFHFTSVQDIVDDCNISKGAFYNYFDSKEALHIAIFQYYFDEINQRLSEIDQLSVNPREKIMRQIRAPFELTNEQREFFVIYLREQSFTINKELQRFIENIKGKTIQLYGKSLKEIYGEEIKPYLSDLILLIEGLTNSYLACTLFHGLKINIDQLPTFILQQIDEAVSSFYKSKTPIILNDFAVDILTNGFFETIDGSKKSISLLEEMMEQLEVLPLNDHTKAELIRVINYLLAELEKTDFDVLLFQGMLANLKEVPEFDMYREKIAQQMNIQLL